MTGSESILWMSVIVIAAGIIAQVIGAFIGIPSIVPLFVLGIVIGPDVLGFLNPKVFGDGLETIIKLSVAIILFEAGLNLDKEEIKKHRKVILPLITYGGLITMFLAAFFCELILGLPWSRAFLFGSLVIVTGPTVIHPLLRRVRVESRLKNVLESEGVFIDPVGAIIAIFVFELVVEKSSSFTHSLSLVFARLGIGALIGVVGGYLIGKIVKKWSLLLEEFVELFVLASALGVYALSEALSVESGLMAAVASGAILGNMDIPEEEPLRKFKGKLSILVISILFVLLAANLELQHIVSLGWAGLLVVVAVLLIVRPVEIFFTTFGTDLHPREKAFLSYICPRGIVAASVSSIFAIQLQNRGLQGGDAVQGLVFLTIGISVLLQGTTANTVAKMLGVLVKSEKTLIIGANSFGRLIGRLLKRNGKEVGFIDTNENLVRIAYTEGFEVIEGNGLDLDKLEEIGIAEADTILAVTTSNKVNILVSRLAKTDFGIKTAFPVLNQVNRGVDGETLGKLGLEIAFGRPLNLYEINPRIAHREFSVWQCSVEGAMLGKKLGELSISDDIIPLLMLKGKSQIPFICSLSLPMEDGDRLIILSLSDGSIALESSGFKSYKPIDL